MLRPRAVVGYYDIEADFSPLFRGRGLVLKVSHTGQPLFFDDIQVNPTYAGMSQNSSSLRHGFHFLAMLPIKFSSRVLGVIACNSFTPRSISDNERRLLLSMVDQLGPALDNLNLAEALRNQGNDLENANRRLQELDRLKSHFLSNVSHELRTPLTAIGSLVDNMLDGVTGDISQKQTQYLTGVKESSERLTRMINDLLDLSIVQSGKFRLEPSRFSLGDLVHEIATSLGTVAQAKSVALQMPHASGDHLAWADRDRIAQVLNNLVGNAIKFTLAGGKVSVDIISTVENDNSIAVSVSDTGPGIPPEECEQIFDEFYQISRPGEEKVKGVGLGLAISKKLVEMNNGKISVESKIGSGTTFKFTVPAFREDSTIAEHYRGARI